MARAPSSKSAQKDTAPGLLPVPETVLRHHARTLAGPMQEWVAQRRVPPVLLMTGTSGIGKRTMGYHLAQWILCERSGFSKPAAATADLDDGGFGMSLFGDAPTEAPAPAATAAPEGDPRPCAECAACLRALKGTWVDFTEILPETDEEGATTGTLKIEQFRRLKSSLGFGAHEGSYRIVLIPNADRMTVQAANSLLKLLEEPPAGWVFFLTASDPTLVLPTILSRCQTLRLKPFAPEEIEELLSAGGVPAERRAIASRLAQGSWSKALALASDEVWERRQGLFDFLKDPGCAVNELVDWASAAPSRFDLLVDQLEQLCSELVRWSVSGGADSYPWLAVDGKLSLVAHARRLEKSAGGLPQAREFWIAQAQRLAEARSQALAPLNRKLLVQDLLLPWLEAGGRA